MPMVTDPKMIQELNDRKRAQDLGYNYDEIANSGDAQVNKRRTGSIFGDVGVAIRGRTGQSGGIAEGVTRGMLADPIAGITQGVLHAGNAAERFIGMDPNKGILGRPGMFSDAQIKYNEAMRKNSEQNYQAAREQQGRSGFDAARLVGGALMPTPGGAGRGVAGIGGAIRQGLVQGAVGSAVQPVDVEPGENYWTKKAGDIVTGAGLGGGLGAAGRVAGRVLAPGVASATRRVAEAAQRLGVPVGIGQITGSRALGRMVHGSANVWGGGAINRGAQRTEDVLGHTIDDIGDTIGGARSTYQGGQAARQGIRGPGGFIERFQNRANALYNQVNAHAPADIDAVGTMLSMQGVRNAFTNNIRLGGLLQNPRLDAFARAIAHNPNGPGRLAFGEAQALRSQIGAMMGDRSLLNDIPRGELSQVYRALTEDMRNGLQQTGNPQALRAFDRASTYWRAGRDRIDNTLEGLIGDNSKSAEQIFNSIGGMAQRNSRGLYQLRRSLRPEEWDDVASSVFHKMGEVSRGTAGEFGEGFSPSQFMTQFNKIQQTPASRRTYEALFGGTRYAHVAQPLRDLATLSTRLKDNSKLANFSGTGHLNSIMAFVGATALSPLLGAKLVGSNMAFSRMMASPTFLRWALGAGRALNGIRRPTAAIVDRVSRREMAKLAGIASSGSAGSEDIAEVLNHMFGRDDPKQQQQQVQQPQQQPAP